MKNILHIHEFSFRIFSFFKKFLLRETDEMMINRFEEDKQNYEWIILERDDFITAYSTITVKRTRMINVSSSIHLKFLKKCNYSIQKYYLMTMYSSVQVTVFLENSFFNKLVL